MTSEVTSKHAEPAASHLALLLAAERQPSASSKATRARSACIPVLGVRGGPRPGRTGKSDSAAKRGEEATLIERPPHPHERRPEAEHSGRGRP